MEETVFQNTHIEIRKDGKAYSLWTLSAGLDMEGLQAIVEKHFPHLLITGLMPAQKALAEAPAGPVPFAIERTHVDIRVSDDGLQAFLTLWVPPAELMPEKRSDLIREIAASLKRAAVHQGILTNVLAGTLTNGQEMLIARGKPPIPGEDAIVTMYELVAPQPEVVEDGSANHYELNLIHQVAKDDWLGERIDPTPGIPGTDVRGGVIPPVPGASTPLRYERASVREEVQPGKTLLRARKAGAVFYRGDVVGVYDFLEVGGNVDYSTGNIDFDGYLSVKGTIDDHFSVAAEQDIEILGEYGVGGAEEIVSRAGNIYIRGGIAGKGRAVIRCRKNLYVKFLSDVTVECEGNVYIGFYAMNAQIRARQVVVESPRGRIVGGHVEVEISIETAEAGNRNETRTLLCVNGFDRNVLRAAYEKAAQAMQIGKKEMGQKKQRLRLFDSGTQTPEQRLEQETLREELEGLKDQLKDVEYEYKSLTDHLRTPGEGAIVVKKRCYPKVRLQIKGNVIEMKEEHPLCTFSYRDGEIVES